MVTDKGDDNKTPTMYSENIDLLRNHDNISRQDDLKCNAAITKWVSDKYVESLFWSHKMVEESCESTLRDAL